MVQEVKAPESLVSTLESAENHAQPAAHEPGCKQTLRIHLAVGSPESCLTGFTTTEPQEQGLEHRISRVLMVGNQLDGKQRKGLTGGAAQCTRNRDEFFFELGKQFNGVSFVRGDLSITASFSADRTRSNGRENIDSARKIRFLIFPNGLEGVMVGKLNFSAPCPQGSSFGRHTVRLLLCGAWSDYQGQFLTSLICLLS